MMTMTFEPAETEVPQASKFQVMPPLADDDFAALKADIKTRGVLVPVEYDEDGNVLDGHHRLKACHQLGITDWPRVVRPGLSEAEKRSHAVAVNIARRHLTSEQKRELIAQQLADTPERSDRAIAGTLGVDHKTVAGVRADRTGRGETPHTETRTDSTGRRQPASKPKATGGSKPSKRTAPADPEPPMPAPADEMSTPEDGEREVARELDARLLDVGRRLLAAAQRYAEVIDEALARPEGEDPVTALSEAEFTGLKAACSRIALFQREFGL